MPTASFALRIRFSFFGLRRLDAAFLLPSRSQKKLGCYADLSSLNKFLPLLRVLCAPISVISVLSFFRFGLYLLFNDPNAAAFPLPSHCGETRLFSLSTLNKFLPLLRVLCAPASVLSVLSFFCLAFYLLFNDPNAASKFLPLLRVLCAPASVISVLSFFRFGLYLLFNDPNAAFLASSASLVISPNDTRATNAFKKYVSFSNLCNPSIFGGLSFQIAKSALSIRFTHNSNPAKLKSARPAIAANVFASRSCSPNEKIARAVSNLRPTASSTFAWSASVNNGCRASAAIKSAVCAVA